MFVSGHDVQVNLEGILFLDSITFLDLDILGFALAFASTCHNNIAFIWTAFALATGTSTLCNV